MTLSNNRGRTAGGARPHREFMQSGCGVIDQNLVMTGLKGANDSLRQADQ